MIAILILALTLIGDSMGHSIVSVRKETTAACSSCLVMEEAQINMKLNVVLNELVFDGCGALCSHVPENMTQHCNRVCFAKGLKLFMVALNVTAGYIDPFAYCELKMGVCPVGQPNAAVALKESVSTPMSGPIGTQFASELHLDVTSPTGLGEVHVYVTQDSNGVSMGGASIPLYDGLDIGTYVIDFALDTTQYKPNPVNEDPPMWYPGTYTIEYIFCQSMCGSKYPESYPIDFGTSKVVITLTEDDLRKKF